MFIVNDRTRSLWAGTNGGHVYVYSISGFESPSTNGSAIATDQTGSCTMGELFMFLFRFSIYLVHSSERNSTKT